MESSHMFNLYIALQKWQAEGEGRSGNLHFDGDKGIPLVDMYSHEMNICHMAFTVAEVEVWTQEKMEAEKAIMDKFRADKKEQEGKKEVCD